MLPLDVLLQTSLPLEAGTAGPADKLPWSRQVLGSDGAGRPDLGAVLHFHMPPESRLGGETSWTLGTGQQVSSRPLVAVACHHVPVQGAAALEEDCTPVALVRGWLVDSLVLDQLLPRAEELATRRTVARVLVEAPHVVL